MIGTTERARQELKKLLEAQTEEAKACLRLVVNEQGQLMLVVDTKREGDKEVEHEGATVMVLGEDLAGELEGITIDVEDTTEGSRLIVSMDQTGTQSPAPDI